jgi:hypothetical protein
MLASFSGKIRDCWLFTSQPLNLFLTQLMLKMSLPSDAVEVSSAFLLLLHSWHDKVSSPIEPLEFLLQFIIS